MNRPSVDQVRAVISALYNDSDPSGKEKASEWLQDLQRSVNIRKLVLYLLPADSMCISFYACTSLSVCSLNVCFYC